MESSSSSEDEKAAVAGGLARHPPDDATLRSHIVALMFAHAREEAQPWGIQLRQAVEQRMGLQEDALLGSAEKILQMYQEVNAVRITLGQCGLKNWLGLHEHQFDGNP